MAKTEARQPIIMIAVGETGVGKTFRTVQEIDQHVKPDPKTGRDGRKVLIFDTNSEDAYSKYRTIDYDCSKDNPSDAARSIINFNTIEVRRVVPFNKLTREPMSTDEKYRTAINLIKNFRNGLILLEDINTYTNSMAGDDFISVMVNNRHRGQDIVLHLQSLSRVTTILWQNVTIIRLHKIVDNIERYKDRLPNYALFRIATQIVHAEYIRGNKRFFVYVNIRTENISGCTIKAFKEAAYNFIQTNCKKELKELSDMIDINTGKRKFTNTAQVIENYYKEYIERYFIFA